MSSEKGEKKPAQGGLVDGYESGGFAHVRIGLRIGFAFLGELAGQIAQQLLFHTIGKAVEHLAHQGLIAQAVHAGDDLEVFDQRFMQADGNGCSSRAASIAASAGSAAAT